jgi:hypothetical protein
VTFLVKCLIKGRVANVLVPSVDQNHYEAKILAKKSRSVSKRPILVKSMRWLTIALMYAVPAKARVLRKVHHTNHVKHAKGKGRYTSAKDSSCTPKRVVLVQGRDILFHLHAQPAQASRVYYETFSVTIPQGIFDGAELRISDKGDAGMYGGPTGDLFIKVRVASDAQFKRVNDDLVCTATLTYPQLVLGGQIEIESIDGSKETIKIPRGCPVGKEILVPGKGFHKVRGSTRGNLVVVTQCHIPKKVSAEAKEALLKYTELLEHEADRNEGSVTSFFKKFLG